MYEGPAILYDNLRTAYLEDSPATRIALFNLRSLEAHFEGPCPAPRSSNSSPNIPARKTKLRSHSSAAIASSAGPTAELSKNPAGLRANSDRAASTPATKSYSGPRILR